MFSYKTSNVKNFISAMFQSLPAGRFTCRRYAGPTNLITETGRLMMNVRATPLKENLEELTENVYLY